MAQNKQFCSFKKFKLAHTHVQPVVLQSLQLSDLFVHVPDVISIADIWWNTSPFAPQRNVYTGTLYICCS